MDDRPQATPPLPADWTVVHDRAICVLDARGYTLQQSISKLRRAFPELVGSVMTPMMIDKRLRILDQNPEIDYFKVGIKFSSKRSNIAGDTTMLEKIPSVRPITDKPPQISSSPLKSRSGRFFLNDDKENHKPATSIEKFGEGPSSSFADTLDGLFLDEAVLVSVVLTVFLRTISNTSKSSRRDTDIVYNQSAHKYSASTKSSNSGKVNTTPFGDGYVSVRAPGI